MQEVILAVWLRFILVMLSKTAKNLLETSAGLIVIQIHRKEIFKITRTHSGMIRHTSWSFNLFVGIGCCMY